MTRPMILPPTLGIPLPPLGLALRLAPDTMHARFLAGMINHLLKGQPLAGELGPLEGRRIRLSVTDTGSEIGFMIRDGTLRPHHRRAEDGWDVRIRGRLEDFWRLATRMEDPDTLFFHRRLDLEGETEAGLYLKNLLDGMEFDWESHVKAVMGQALGQRMVTMVRRTGLDRAARHLLHTALARTPASASRI